jgi:superfamily II DNA or RNA helicase
MQGCRPTVMRCAWATSTTAPWAFHWQRLLRKTCDERACELAFRTGRRPLGLDTGSRGPTSRLAEAEFPVPSASDVPAIRTIRRRLEELETERLALERALSELEEGANTPPPSPPTMRPAQKIALFRSLFSGRPDVFALRWENLKDGRSGYAPACANEWAAGICAKPRIKCGQCPNQAFLPVTDAVIVSHLRGTQNARRGEFVMGLYPLLADDTCSLLAFDFDEESWAEDALAFIATCRARKIPAALERSRSGKGAHVWIFFASRIAAREARQFGSALLTETMERRPEMSFDSYDRMFPSQDSMPAGGFGNLIALPLAKRAREVGNAVFIDDQLQPYPDQWAFLSSLERVSEHVVNDVVREAQETGRILGVRMPVEDDEAEDPWLLPPSRSRVDRPVVGKLPQAVKVVLADGVYIERAELPPDLIARLVRLAAFQNPEFYRAQGMRLSTFGKPRIISCAELQVRYVSLPRGCLDAVVGLLRSSGVRALVEDRRESGSRLAVSFLGALRPDQQRALEALTAHDFGVLAAGTAFGKTLVAAAAIAERACSTLILVHRRELLTQWTERLRTFLDAEDDDIGVIGGGKRKPSGRIDVALLQSLVRNGKVSDLVAGYGQVIVDECHHISARSFELIARRSKARYVVGLSATVTRKDGHHPIIFMQCGPVRHRVDPRAQAAARTFDHLVRERHTRFELPSALQTSRPSMPAIFAALAQDGPRNVQIIDDVLAALEAGRNPLVLTERRDHLDYLEFAFRGAARNIVVLRGGMSAKDRSRAEEAIAAPETEERLFLATGRYLGEGFDEARLDTLFLAMPISWKGTLAQYVGRLHRDYASKREVVVYDYVDANVPVLARMASKRQAGYRALGYRIVSSGLPTSEPTAVREIYVAGDDRDPSEVVDQY